MNDIDGEDFCGQRNLYERAEPGVDTVVNINFSKGNRKVCSYRLFNQYDQNLENPETKFLNYNILYKLNNNVDLFLFDATGNKFVNITEV